MEKQVEISTYCMVVSALTTAIICGIFVYVLKQSEHETALWILGTMIVMLFLLILFYMPLSISVDTSSLDIKRPLRVKSIPLTEISEVALCSPTMGARRICGSGGWFGWYGWFEEKDLGKYFAYYGKASDCFLVTLKDGKKYMLGCKEARMVADAIKERIERRYKLLIRLGL